MARFHLTAMVCALIYLKRLTSVAEAVSTQHDAITQGKLTLLSSLLKADGWQVHLHGIRHK